MDGSAIKEIIISLIVSLNEFDWAIIIPFIIFTVVIYLIIKDTDNEVEKQNNILSGRSSRRSRYNDQ